MPVALIAIYLNRKEIKTYFKHKKELNKAGRKAFKKLLDKLKK